MSTTEIHPFIELIGLSSNDKRAHEILSSLGVGSKVFDLQEKNYRSIRTGNFDHIDFSRSSKALKSDCVYIDKIISFADSKSFQLPFSLKSTDNDEAIHAKLNKFGTRQKDDRWLLAFKGKDYEFSLDQNTNEIGLNSIYSYYLYKILEVKKVPNLSVFNFHNFNWCSAEEIQTVWSPFAMTVSLEDDIGTFSKENIHFMKSVIEHNDLKDEIEKSVFDHYQHISDDYKKINTFPIISCSTECWKLLKPWAFKIYKDKTLAIEFDYITYDHGIRLIGNIGALSLESFRITK